MPCPGVSGGLGPLVATTDLAVGRNRPFVTVHGPEPSTVEGLAGRLAQLFPGHPLGWQGLRRPGQTAKLKRLQVKTGSLLTRVLTVAVAVAVTTYVTKLLS